MLNRVLKIGQRIEFKRIHQLKKDILGEVPFTSSVLEINGDYTMTVALPILDEEVVNLKIGSYYELMFAANQGAYSCKCEILDRFKFKNEFAYSIRVVSELKKIQRRHYFRVEKAIPMRCRVCSEAEKFALIKYERNDFENAKEKEEYKKKLEQFEIQDKDAMIVNISGGGLKFSYPGKIKRGAIVSVRFVIDRESDIVAFGRNLEDGICLPNTGEYVQRLEFIKLSKEDKERIIKYVFETERKDEMLKSQRVEDDETVVE